MTTSVWLGPPVCRAARSAGTINPARGEVIWFTGYDRVSPGQLGTAVIARHVTYGGVSDAFANLVSVDVGDSVTIDYADGTSVTADVVDTKLVAKEELSHDPAVWGSNSESRRVVLITCDDALGQRADGHQVANFVVVAEISD
ncbi:MAG TPA: class F sortase [Ornithinicoccus sp.]|nr:class F sortase [Ornithinicoccus sp.]